jgi:DNA repair exonuclease SbcCD ATPase subunit
MRKSILILTIPALVSASLLFTGCSTSADKVENAKQDVTDAKADLRDAKADLKDANREYLADVESYRRETAEKIEDNNQSIIAFKARIKNEKAEASENYKKKLAELERKNADMKKRMEDYQADGKDNWETFKMEFNRDMESLGLAFKNLTVNNVK